MELTSMDYGRSEDGRKKLASDLQNDIDAGVKALSGGSYDNVISTVRKYWQGDDADKFVDRFKKSSQDLAAKFKEYKNAIGTALDNDDKQFRTMQSTQASNVDSMISNL